MPGPRFTEGDVERLESAAPGARSDLELRTRRVGSTALVSMRLRLRGGSRCEAKPGLAWVTGRLLLEGTRSRDWRRIAFESDDRGMVLTSFGDLESHGLRLDCLEADWRRGLEWLSELVHESDFPEDRLRWVCRQGAAELESLGDQPDVKTGWAFAEQLYGPHAAGRAVQGTPESLDTIDRSEVESFHAAGVREGGVLSIAGRVDEDEVTTAAQALFAGVGGCTSPRSPVARPESSAESRREIFTGAVDQAHLLVGHLSLPLADPDYRAAEALSVVLGSGSGLTGRIPRRIREQDGLAYSAWATAAVGAGLDEGRLMVALGTSSETLEVALRGVREELERLVVDGVSQGELDDARSYLLGREPFRREVAGQLAELDAQAAFYGIELDRPDWLEEGLRDLTCDDLNALARRLVRLEDLRVAIGWPSDGQRAP